MEANYRRIATEFEVKYNTITGESYRPYLVRGQQHHRRQPGKVFRPQGREERVLEVTVAGVGTDALLAVELVLEQIAVRVCEDRVALPASKPAPR